ncbi:ModD protein [Acetobacterium bakii]|uniref:Putative pyrophosphorylase ModD n=1 Tax=Acetobacterium bakii TaxID=52689 RepID=A0A0L6U4Q9_9FIRM|nr:ModD protein [Acetobacterium bakii]KNZ43488.1 pyrophosphorylase [Acetobacterium bakii]
MSFISINEIDRLINEDVPYIDLTSWSLGIKEQPGEITYFTREDATVCGTEEVRAIFDRLRIETRSIISSGQKVSAGAELISGTGRAQDLHIAWKVGQNILDSCSGIATKTRRMVDVVKSCNPKMAVLTTRKGFPGTKALATKAIMAGGAMPHRLGLSETILIFKQHMNFIGGFEGLLNKLPEMKTECCEKKVIVEAATLEQAISLCRAGADGIQFDKMGVEELIKAVDVLRNEFPSSVLLAAGGINETNIAAYAKTNVNGIITTSLYSAKPIDIGVKIG